MQQGQWWIIRVSAPPWVLNAEHTHKKQDIVSLAIPDINYHKGNAMNKTALIFKPIHYVPNGKMENVPNAQQEAIWTSMGSA